MKKLSSWLLTIFIIMFWVFRIIVAFVYNMGWDFPIKPLDFNVEMILLFVTFFAILLILGRKLLGGIIYVISNIYYFGSYVYQFVAVPDKIMDMNDVMNIFMAVVALGLSIGILLDLALNQDRHEGKDDKNTHWFYKNEQFDRKLDERADKNQYRL